MVTQEKYTEREGENNMILYLGASLYHILCFSVHKMIHHPKEEAMLIVGDNIFSKNGMDELKTDIMGSGIFQRMEILKFIEGAYHNPVRLDEDSTKEDVNQFVKENNVWVEKWLSKKEIQMESMTHIYSAIDHRHLGLYILSKQMPYAYFEDGNGLLSREFVQLEFHKNAQYESYAICKFLGGLGQNDSVIKKYANLSAQLPGFQDDKAEDFQVISLFETLSKDMQQIIFHMYHMEEVLDFHGTKPVLFLTRYAKYMKNPTVNRHHFMATILVDLFGDQRPLVLKAHPRDFSGRYAEILPDAKIMARQFPSELLPFVTKEKYQKVITVGSTAIDALTECAEEIIKLNETFEDKLNQIYSYVGMIMAIKRAFPDIKEGEIGYAGPIPEFIAPLGIEYLGISIEEAVEEKEYKVLWLDQKNYGMYYGENLCTLYPQYLDKIDEEKMFYLEMMARKTKKSSLGYEGEEILSFQFGNPKNKERLKGWSRIEMFEYTKSRMSVSEMPEKEQEYKRECDKIRELHGKIDLPKLGESVTEEDVFAMKRLKEKVRKINENSSICTNEIK